MAVISCTPWTDDHRSRAQVATSTAILYYTAICDPGTLPCEVEGAPGFGIGSPMPNDPLQRLCSAIEATAVTGSNIVYRIGVEFDNSLGEIVTDPTARVFRPSLDFEESREPRYVDGDGNAIANSVGMSFDPPYEETVSDAVITLVNNSPTWRVLVAAAYKDAVSSDNYFDSNPGELKVVGVTINPLTENGVDYYQETWRIKVRLNFTVGGVDVFGWSTLILDEGRYENHFDTSTGAFDGIIPIFDKNGDPVADPVKLDGGGSELTPDGGANPNDDDFISSDDENSAFRVVLPRKMLPFSGIGLKVKI